MSSLQIIKRHRKHPARRPGSKEWCADVKEVALTRALETVEKEVRISATDTTHLLKIKKGLAGQRRLSRKVTWLDPQSWKLQAAERRSSKGRLTPLSQT